MKFGYAVYFFVTNRKAPQKSLECQRMSTHQNQMHPTELRATSFFQSQLNIKWVFVCESFQSVDSLYWFPKWCLFAIIFSIPDSRPFIDRKVLCQNCCNMSQHIGRGSFSMNLKKDCNWNPIFHMLPLYFLPL